MAATALATISDEDGGASAVSASITPTANALVICDVLNINADLSPGDTPTVSGNGLTWVQVATLLYGPGSGLPRLTRFRALGASPTSGAVTVSCSVNQALICASIYEIAGVDTSGSNGSGAIVQTVTDTPSVVDATSTPTVTLAAFASSANLAIGALGYGGDQFDTAPGTGFTGVHEISAGGVTSILATEYKLNDTTVDWDLLDVGGGGYTVGAIASEIKAAASLAYEQEGFRWRNDDGSESAATWAATQDTDITAAAGEARRLRMLTNVSGDAPSEGLKLQYRKAGTSEWKDILRQGL